MRYYGIQNEVKAYLNRLQSETSIQVTPSIVKTLNDRVESLKKSGVWSQYGLGFNDVDADSYFQRASVNDVIGRSEVCWFVRGMKSLGLWQNMVSWPLRSYQNAGTGSTVYSLGGLGVYNGTMTNLPTWGSEGITFIKANSAFIAHTGLPIFGRLASFAVFKLSDTLGTQCAFGLNGTYWTIGVIEAAQIGRIFRTRNITAGVDDYRFTQNHSIDTFTTITNIQNGTIKAQIKDGGLNTQSKAFSDILTGSTQNSALFAGNSAGGDSLNGIGALVLYLTVSTDTSIANKLHNLYKQTLGNGLGLP